MQEKEFIVSERYGSTNLSLGSLFGITRQSLVMPNSDSWDRFVDPVPRQSLVMPNSDPWDRFVDPYLTLMTDSYIPLMKLHVAQLICAFVFAYATLGDPYIILSTEMAYSNILAYDSAQFVVIWLGIWWTISFRNSWHIQLVKLYFRKSSWNNCHLSHFQIN